VLGYGDKKLVCVCKAPVLVVVFMKRSAMKHQVSEQTTGFCPQELAVNAVHQYSVATLIRHNDQVRQKCK